MATEANKTGNTAGEGGDGNAVSFDDKQQERVNEIVKERLARQETSLKKTFDEQLATTKAEFESQIEELKKKTSTKKTGDGNGNDGNGAGDITAVKEAIESQFKELLATEKAKNTKLQERLQGVEKERESFKTEAYRVRKNVAMREAAAEAANFYDVKEVLELTGSKIDFDDESGEWVVKENGVVRSNSELKPMSLVEFYQEWAAKRPHFVNGDMRGGVGSSTSRGKSDLTGKAQYRSQLKTPQAIAEFIKKYTLAEYEKLPLKPIE